MEKVFLRTAHNYDMNKAGDESGLHCKDKTLAQQQFRDECDINTIVERFGLTGTVPQTLHLPSAGDFTGVFDYQTAMNAVVTARESFMQLPAKTRARFDNKPQKLLEFLEDEDNLDEARKLGLVNKPKPDVDPSTGEIKNKTGDTPDPKPVTK